MAAILELQSVPLVSFRKKTGRTSYCKKREHVKLRFSSSVVAACAEKETVSGSVSGRQTSRVATPPSACGFAAMLFRMSAHARSGWTYRYIYINRKCFPFRGLSWLAPAHQLDECSTLMASGSEPIVGSGRDPRAAKACRSALRKDR